MALNKFDFEKKDIEKNFETMTLTTKIAFGKNHLDCGHYVMHYHDVVQHFIFCENVPKA